VAAKGVGRRATVGIAWTLLGAMISNIARVAIVAILGRLLLPEDFGVVAVAMTVVLFAGRFHGLGFGLALVQRKQLEREHVATAFAMSLSLGTAIALITFLAAGAIGDAYQMPHAAAPIRALALLFVLRALSSTSRFMMQRELRFRALAITNVVSYLVGSGTSIVLALDGHGAWALVIGYLVEAALETVLLVVVSPPTAFPRFTRWALRDLFSFGGGHVLAMSANYLATQGDYIIVGRFLGDAMLGIYSRAYELMRFPALIFTNVAGTVLFSSFSRLQDDPVRLGQMLRRTLFATAILLLPASAGLIVLAPEAIYILLGPGWDGVVLPFQLMAATMLFRTTYKAAGLVTRSAGAVLRNAGSQALYALAVIGGALISVRWGIVGVSITTGLAVVFHYSNLMRLALRQVSLSWSDVLMAHIDGLVLSVLVVIGSLPVALALRSAGYDVVTVAVLATVAGTIPGLVFAGFRIRRGAEDWVWMIDRIRSVVRKKRKKRRRGDGDGDEPGADLAT
jgi:O-antigen/teichoic acid export membrane protein